MGLFDYVRFESPLPSGYRYSEQSGGRGWSQTKFFEDPRMLAFVMTDDGWAIDESLRRQRVFGDVAFWARRDSNGELVPMIARFETSGLRWIRPADEVDDTAQQPPSDETTEAIYERIAGPLNQLPNQPDS